jgi:hypothetical protein
MEADLDFDSSILDLYMSVVDVCTSKEDVAYGHEVRFLEQQGGTGKTSLAFQAVTRYAELHPTARVLVIDACPQANMSELLLGGMTNNGGPSCSNSKEGCRDAASVDTFKSACHRPSACRFLALPIT